MTNEDRNQQIVADIQAVRDGRTPLVLTNRTDHLEQLASGLSELQHVFVLKGGMGKKQRQAIAERLASIPDGTPRVLLATGSYIGEGFDDSRLDTLFLTMPISWLELVELTSYNSRYIAPLHFFDRTSSGLTEASKSASELRSAPVLAAGAHPKPDVI